MGMVRISWLKYLKPCQLLITNYHVVIALHGVRIIAPLSTASFTIIFCPESLLFSLPSSKLHNPHQTYNQVGWNQTAAFMIYPIIIFSHFQWGSVCCKVLSRSLHSQHHMLYVSFSVVWNNNYDQQSQYFMFPDLCSYGLVAGENREGMNYLPMSWGEPSGRWSWLTANVKWTLWPVGAQLLAHCRGGWQRHATTAPSPEIIRRGTLTKAKSFQSHALSITNSVWTH